MPRVALPVATVRIGVSGRPAEPVQVTATQPDGRTHDVTPDRPKEG